MADERLKGALVGHRQVATQAQDEGDDRCSMRSDQAIELQPAGRGGEQRALTAGTPPPDGTRGRGGSCRRRRPNRTTR